MSELESPMPVESDPAGDAPPNAGGTAQARLKELKEKVSSAAKLIAELRDRNYALASEVAALNRRVQELEASPRPEPPAEEVVAAPEAEASPRERDQLALLLEERKAIRRKLEKLVERVEKLEV